VVKHSGSANAELAATVAEHEVAVEVRNDPPVDPLLGSVIESGGMGTIPMRERCVSMAARSPSARSMMAVTGWRPGFP
jgi:hypothetical protein